MFNKSVLSFSLAIFSLTACGQDATSGGSKDAKASAVVASFDSALKSDATSAYVSSANSSQSCQTEVAGLDSLSASLSTNLSSGTSINDAAAQVNAALNALATCVSASNTNLPAIPQVSPAGSAGASCSVAVVNGQVTQTGDCTGCKVDTTANNVNVACTGGTVSAPVTTPVTNPGAGAGNASNTCSVSLVNGQVSQSGDCTGCEIKRNGDSVSAVCNGSGAGNPTVPANPIPATTNPGTGAGNCSVVNVNGKVETTGDCSNCDIQQNGGNVSVVCR